MLTQAPSDPLPPPATTPTQHTTSHTTRRLQGHWLWSARAIWAALFALMLILNGAAIVAHLENNAVGSGAAGLVVERTDDHAYTLRLNPQGPAARAGILEGDRLIAIEGVPIQADTPYQEVNRRLHGEIGSTLTITVQGANDVLRQHTLVLSEEHQVWRRFRLPLGRVGIYFPLLEAVLLAAYLLTAMLLFWRRSDDWMALFLSATLVLITPQLSYSWYFLSQNYGLPDLLLNLLVSVGVAFTLLNFYLLPDGRFVPRWTLWLAILWVIWSFAIEFFPNAPFSIYGWSGAAQLLVWLGWFATGMLAQAYRYRYDANAEERQQIKWIAFGLTIAVLANLGWTLAFEIFPALNHPGTPNLLMWLGGRTLYVLGMMMLPIAFGIAVFRYRLWDIDSLINHTLVYSALTAIIVGIYVVVVTVVEVFFDSDGSMFALALDLVLLDPLRERLQQGADRLMYGEQEDGATISARLRERLQCASGPEAELPTIAETLGEALSLPYVAIALAEGDAYRIAARYGDPVVATYTSPLVYQGRSVGQLILAPRRLGQSLTPADWEIVESIAHHASVTAHYTLLLNELKG